MAGASRFCRQSFVTADPFAEAEAFAKDVGEICRSQRIDIVFPCHEDALPLRHHEKVLPAGVRLACPPMDPLRECIDKARMTQLAEKAGLDIPRSIFPDSPEALLAGIESWPYPVVIKLRRANSGKGVYIEHSQAQVRARIQSHLEPYFDRDGRHPYAQHFVAGDVVGAGFLAIDGRMVAFFGERYVRTKNGGIGTSTYRVPFDNQSLRDSTSRMVEALGWSGIGHLDFIEDRATGKLRFLEVNPRSWGGIHHAIANGHDFPAALIAHLEGRACLDSYFSSATEGAAQRPSLWMLGDMIRMVHLLKEGDWRRGLFSPLQTLRDSFRARVDDFSLSDPAPFFAQAWCYGREFLRSGGNTNPDSDGMTD